MPENAALGEEHVGVLGPERGGDAGLVPDGVWRRVRVTWGGAEKRSFGWWGG